MKVLALAALLACSIVGYGQGDDELIRVDSSIVVVNASVTGADGKAVAGLRQAQFKILEDGVEQTIESFGAELTPFAAVILIDTSGSMGKRLGAARSAAVEFLYGLRGDDNCAIYHFHSKVEMVQDFSNSRDIREQVFDIEANGMTVLNDAIHKAAEVLARRPEKRRAIIVLSDGADTQSRRNSNAALRAALAVDANIYTVDMASDAAGGRGRPQDRAVLRNFAEKTGGRFVATPDGIEMRDALKRIVQELGGQYTLTYQSKNPARDGKWRSIELRIAKPNLSIRTRRGYNAPKD
jgi:Ca-activated chloride channel homolog